nr:hypothetical protein [Bathymodiolus japonicus methanotrophic gill symbiont]
MAFYFVSTFANAQTPKKQRPYGYRGLKIFTSLKLRFPDFQRVSSHSKKRFVIALKYEGENDYRYLVATDLTWRTQDIIQAYTLRWLIEVFFEDWKLYEGWGREAKQLQARHATSRNSGTPVAVIRSPTQRIGDAPAALRPPQTEHKADQSWLPQMALRLFGIKF